MGGGGCAEILYICGKLSGRMRLLVYILVCLLVAGCASDAERVAPQVEEALYHFYTGESYSAEHKYYEAMEEFLKAEQLSAGTDKVVLKGQICWNKGCLYAAKMNYSNALEMFSRALEYFALAGSDVREYEMRTYEQIAKVYGVNGNLGEAVNYYGKAMDMAQQMRAKMLFSPHDSVVVYKEGMFNEALMGYSTELAALYCKMDGGEDRALEQLKDTYNKFNDSIVNPADFPLLAKIYLQKGDVEKASESIRNYNSYIAKGGVAVKDPVKMADMYFVSAETAQAKGDYKGASEYRMKYILIKDSIDLAVRKESVQEAERQFWQRQLEEENHNMKMRTYGLVVFYVVLVLVMGGAVAYIFSSYRRKLRLKNEQLAQYADEVDSLGTRVSSAESVRENLLTQLDVHKAKEKELKELLENRFSEVRELLRTYYEFGNSKKLQKKVDDLLKLQLSGDNLEVIEQAVNAKNNDVIKKVREKYPAMKEESIKLLNLIYAGFSAQEISVILNDTPQNIYVRKSRLKKAIQELILQDPQMNF